MRETDTVGNKKSDLSSLCNKNSRTKGSASKMSLVLQAPYCLWGLQSLKCDFYPQLQPAFVLLCITKTFKKIKGEGVR